MTDDIALLEEQIARCRRLAGSLSDYQLRQSLEELADKYEARLRQRTGAGFLLQPGNGS
jgi:hypothetical protein